MRFRRVLYLDRPAFEACCAARSREGPAQRLWDIEKDNRAKMPPGARRAPVGFDS